MSRTHNSPSLLYLLKSIIEIIFFFYIFQVATSKPQWNTATAKPAPLHSATSKAPSGTAKVKKEKNSFYVLLIF
jgi:hypothetical protein